MSFFKKLIKGVGKVGGALLGISSTKVDLSPINKLVEQQQAQTQALIAQNQAQAQANVNANNNSDNNKDLMKWIAIGGGGLLAILLITKR